MATFTNTSSTTGFDAMSFAQNVASSRDSQRDITGLKGFFNRGGEYSVVGINTTKIPEMKQAIQTYVNDIKDHLSKIAVETDPSIALKGTGMEQAVREYVENVVKYCQALCSNLLAFSDKLTKVEEAWRQSDTNMSGVVNNASGDLKAAAQNSYETPKL